MHEFEEIAHTGGKLTFIHESEGGLSVRLEHSTPLPATVFQVCINMDGQVVDYVAIGGIGGASFYPQPSVLAYLISDREGMFGQKCKACESYFRCSTLSRTTICPYCGDRKHGVVFLTANQLQFLTKYFNTYMEALEKAQTVTVDLDQMLDGLSNNTHSWVYKEERQQSLHRCSSCRCRYDVLGSYALCPSCGTPNFLSSYENGLAELQTQLSASSVHRGDVPGELFAKAFTEYEALGNCVRTQLLRIPATDRRKAEVRRINFQRMGEAAELLERFFAIRVNDNLSAEDMVFIHLMVSRRHLFIHNAGRVDEKYLEITKDTTVKLNETVRLSFEQATKVVDLLRTCGRNLIKDWQSIK